ncbi:MAG TPA: flagellar basal-body rod protein FlgG [Bacteroidota bacterium]|nr:flagellar basal-body rod protein FlgG [Bacteroidota bacterium]
MNRALRTAASGMAAQQMNVEIIANNLANVSTTGFKKSRPEFQDLMYQTLRTSGVSQNPNIREPIEIQVGNGTVPVATLKSFDQGTIQTTNNTLDIAIQGDGFLQVRRPDGTIAYTRDGSLKLSADGTLVTAQGYIFEPGITLGSDTAAVTIARDGTIDVTTSSDSNPTKAGQIELAKFVNPAGLRAIGNSLFVETPASGAPIPGTPGSEGFGEIMQGSLETSNVDVVEEMVGMITAQRAYEMNAKTITAVDEMLSTANAIKR